MSLTGATVEGVPAEATILDASQFSWPFDISLEQQLYWHFTVRLQILAANATVDASIYSGEAGNLVLQESDSKMGDATETELVGVTFPAEWLQRIDKVLGPMQKRQDFIRMAVEEKLAQLPQEKKEAP